MGVYRKIAKLASVAEFILKNIQFKLKLKTKNWLIEFTQKT